MRVDVYVWLDGRERTTSYCVCRAGNYSENGERGRVTAMNKHAWWAWAVKNSIIMICWTALAIFFGKWWIALFVAIFISGMKEGYND